MTLALGMSGFALPRTTVAARLALTKGKARAGQIFVSERVSQHSGHETPLEMLNRPEGFFPFRPDGGKEVLLVTKAQTITLAVSHATTIPDPERMSAATLVGLAVSLIDGSTLSGMAAFEAPMGHTRLLDYLNSFREPFFAVSTADATYYVNRSHVLYARPEE